jgi:hypothetical protein
MKNHLLFLLFFSTLFIGACSDEESKPTAADSDKLENKDISRDGAIETLLGISHLDDSRDVLTTTHKIWKDGVLINTVLHVDTLPALGVSNNIKAADERGETTTASGKKDYEFYITVK